MFYLVTVFCRDFQLKMSMIFGNKVRVRDNGYDSRLHNTIVNFETVNNIGMMMGYEH